MDASRESRYLLLEDQRPHKIPRIDPAASVIHLPWSARDSQAQHNDYQHSSLTGTEEGAREASPVAATLPAGPGQPLRTRGTVACRKCRSRKTKCDNQRPSCGYCLKIGEPCVYETEASSCCHVFGREVLQALNELREIVSKPPTEQFPVDSPEVTASSRERISSSTGPASVITSTPQPATPSSHLRLRPAAASLRWTQKIENIIQWRIFQSHIVASDIYPDADLPVTLDHSMPSTDIRLLTDLESRYLHSVHLFNPILHLPTLHGLILRVAESHFDWSPENCLVALVCAIGAMTEPLETSLTPEASTGMEADDSRNRSDPNLAVGYWNVASKRLGLVLDRNDITAVQCLCLAGIRHMLNLQPLQAWKYFSHAGNAWFCTVMRNGPLPRPPERTHFGPICVQDALCFTIWKSIWYFCSCSEISGPSIRAYASLFSELHPELSLPPSVLQDCEVLRPFPTLPDLDDPRLGDPLIDSERSWLYYLAEIAARHLINDLLECHVYDFDSLQRADVVRMIRHTEIFEAQIDEWRSSLPAQLQFEMPEDWTLPELDHPMKMVLRQRYLSSLELTYRPLLRLCTDFSLEDFQGYEASLLSRVVKLASQNLRFSYLKIVNTSRSLHQGTWFNLRSLTGSCLRFAAAEKAQRDGKLAGAQEVQIPPGWRSCVMKAIETLQPYWASKRGGGAGLMDLMDQTLAM